MEAYFTWINTSTWIFCTLLPSPAPQQGSARSRLATAPASSKHVLLSSRRSSRSFTRKIKSGEDKLSRAWLELSLLLLVSYKLYLWKSTLQLAEFISILQYWETKRYSRCLINYLSWTRERRETTNNNKSNQKEQQNSGIVQSPEQSKIQRPIKRNTEKK